MVHEARNKPGNYCISGNYQQLKKNFTLIARNYLLDNKYKENEDINTLHFDGKKLITR